MKFTLGKKENMMQVWDEEGTVSPSTVLSVSPLKVIALKTKEKDGYDAIQVGTGTRATKNINKAQQGQWKDLGDFEFTREFRDVESEGMNVGDEIKLSNFEVGDVINVSGVTKGKGFQGGVKRHNFSGGPRTHGNKHAERAPGSIGATGPARVFKGTKMAGRMGADRVTVKNLKVIQVDEENGTLLVKGAIPGRRGTVIEVREVIKKAKA